MNQDDIIRIAREACPYITDEMRGAFYEGFLKGAVAEREWVDLTDDEMLMIYGQDHEGKKYNLGRMVQQALKERNT